MSLSLEPELHEYLKEYAKQEGISASKLVRDIVDKYLVKKDKLIVVEKSEEHIPVVLKIPADLRGDDRLREWLQVRCDAIASKLV
jgi:metal-responsive CopG/Arc/MetJ family transcriptional regulator